MTNVDIFCPPAQTFAVKSTLLPLTAVVLVLAAHAHAQSSYWSKGGSSSGGSSSGGSSSGGSSSGGSSSSASRGSGPGLPSEGNWEQKYSSTTGSNWRTYTDKNTNQSVSFDNKTSEVIWNRNAKKYEAVLKEGGSSNWGDQSASNGNGGNSNKGYMSGGNGNGVPPSASSEFTQIYTDKTGPNSRTYRNNVTGDVIKDLNAPKGDYIGYNRNAKKWEAYVGENAEDPRSRSGGGSNGNNNSTGNPFANLNKQDRSSGNGSGTGNGGRGNGGGSNWGGSNSSSGTTGHTPGSYYNGSGSSYTPPSRPVYTPPPAPVYTPPPAPVYNYPSYGHGMYHH